MRLWHSKLIPLLDNPRLSDLHMSCCNMRGNGWGKRNVSINYLYQDTLGEDALAVYHMRVLDEMDRRGFRYEKKWWDPQYCGSNRSPRTSNPQAFEDALCRDVPLLGHTVAIFNNDVSDLRKRGLPIKTTVDTFRGNVRWVAQLGNTRITYVEEQSR